ncbi:MAG TPA: rhomboid family intramembrane serine protease [Acidobacteriota bacterium]|nr:rhomboid family intramembrane serine protease [Acidobacteriota bacterium]
MFIFLPVGHEQQTVQRLPWITFSLIALNLLVFFIVNPGRSDLETAMNEKYDRFLTYYVQHPYLEFPDEMRGFLNESDNERIDLLSEGAETSVDSLTLQEEQEELNDLKNEVLHAINNHPFRHYGYTPAKPKVLNLITCLFLHDGYFHLFGNLLFLFLAGCAIEDGWGRPLYLGFYLISGIIASLTFQLANSQSMIPLVGASGAIAGLMGAFLVRFAKTKIRFFYIFFLFLIRTGSFYAPAYVVLPLWFGEQVLYAWLYEGKAGVAFSAHVGGFAFGAAVALIMKFTEFEEKYIAPSIEKKVSLQQSPLFLKGIQLAEIKDYPGALIHLQKVVREDPNHFEAFMEMRRIAEVTGDRKGYNRNMAGIFDLLLRNRDFDLFVDLYTQYKDHPFRDLLPARTLMAIGLFFEEQGDIPAAIGNLEALVDHYDADPLSMKAYAKMARLFLDKLNDRSKALEMLREAYFHPQASQDWRSALGIEMKKYGLTPDDLGGVALQSVAATSTAISESNRQPVALAEHAQVIQTAPQIPAPSQSEAMTIPSVGTRGDLNVAQCKIDKIGLNGLVLSNQAKRGELPWKRIHQICVASLKELQRAGNNSLVIDLVVNPAGGQHKVIYRLLGTELNFDRIFPRVEQSFDEGYQNLMGIILRNSNAKCVPDKNRVMGPNYLLFSTMEEYENFLQQNVR